MIDFILPWVDGSDKEWQKIKSIYEKKKIDMRFRDLGTLKYVLRSIEKFAPWYNKIHLITEGHYPEWLNINHEKINLVTHDKLFFDSSDLPTFNSRAIEMNLANIKGTSNQIVYLNDDTLLYNHVTEERFFKNGVPVDFFSHGWFLRGKLYESIRGPNNWVNAINNNLTLINKTFIPHELSNDALYHPSYNLTNKISNFMFNNVYKKIFWLEHWHHPRSLLLSNIKECYNEYESEIRQTSKNRFRCNEDLNPYIYRYWHLVKNDFYPYKHHDGYVCRITKFTDLEDGFKYLANDEMKNNFACLNDSMSTVSDEEFKRTKALAIEELDSIFPDKAKFEI